MGDWPRVIAHADMDAFYAAVEQLDHPQLRGKPVIVGPNSRRGVVLTASYEARPAGVGSAMPMAVARRRCPEAVVVPPRFERYREISRTVMGVFTDFSPVVEPLSLDEAFLDMSGSSHIFGDPAAFARKLKHAIAEATGGLTASIGVSGTKYIAKVASAYRKPDGLTIVEPARAREWLAPQPVAVLWGAGPKLQAKLAALGIATVGAVAAADARRLTTALGQVGLKLQALARGEDPRSVQGAHTAKSLSCEHTLETDVRSSEEIRFHLRQAAETVGRRLRKQGYMARGVRVKLKRSDFRLLTRQATLAEPTQSAARLCQAAVELAADLEARGPYRLVGLAAFELVRRDATMQLDLLAPTSSRARKLEAVLDALDERFGPGTVQRAREGMRPAVIEGGTDLDFLTTDGADAESD
jgi:DNA polymerase-4